MTKYEIYEIMSLPSDNSTSLIVALNILMKYFKVQLLTTTKNELYYQIEINDIILSNMTSDELIKIRNNNWNITKDKKRIIKKI